jgi:hypothetical protein
MSWEMELNDEMLETLYEWIDKIPLSRQKKRIERDFSDGYCVGEIIKYFLPNLIEMHNLTPAHNLQQKLSNWGILNAKVFSRFGLNVPLNISQNICNCKPGYIEVFLYNLRIKIDEKLHENERQIVRRQSKTISQSPRSSIQMNSPVSLIGGNSKAGKAAAIQMRLEYEEKVQECLKQAEEIEILSAKVRRLEHLLELKDTRINDLTERLDKFRPTGFMSKSSSLFQSSSLLPKKHNVSINGLKERNSIAI